MNKLKTLDLSCSGITELEGLENVPNLETLRLESTKSLFTISFTQPLEQLSILSLWSSNISTLTGLENLENLRELDLERAANMTHLKFEKDTKDLVLKLKGSGITSSTDIEGFEHLDPSKVHF